MGKGEAWVNGQSIGRYWISFHTSKGTPSQALYVRHCFFFILQVSCELAMKQTHTERERVLNLELNWKDNFASIEFFPEQSGSQVVSTMYTPMHLTWIDSNLNNY